MQFYIHKLTDGFAYLDSEFKHIAHDLNGEYFIYEDEEHTIYTKYIFKNGKLHSLTEAAFQDVDGTLIWFKNGKLHRKNNLPAVEYCPYNSGSKEWYFNGLPHRTNGPAIYQKNGNKKWYLHGIEYTEEKFYFITLKRKHLKEKLDKNLVSHMSVKQLKI